MFEGYITKYLDDLVKNGYKKEVNNNTYFNKSATFNVNQCDYDCVG